MIITKQFLRDNCGCYLQSTLESKSFMQGEGDETTLELILASEIRFKDKVWFWCNKIEKDKMCKFAFAIDCAELVLPIFEKKYPDDKRPRNAIEAAKKYLKEPCEENRLIAAADAAADAAGIKNQLLEILKKYALGE